MLPIRLFVLLLLPTLAASYKFYPNGAPSMPMQALWRFSFTVANEQGGFAIEMYNRSAGLDRCDFLYERRHNTSVTTAGVVGSFQTGCAHSHRTLITTETCCSTLRFRFINCLHVSLISAGLISRGSFVFKNASYLIPTNDDGTQGCIASPVSSGAWFDEDFLYQGTLSRR